MGGGEIRHVWEITCPLNINWLVQVFLSTEIAYLFRGHSLVFRGVCDNFLFEKYIERIEVDTLISVSKPIPINVLDTPSFSLRSMTIHHFSLSMVGSSDVWTDAATEKNG